MNIDSKSRRRFLRNSTLALTGASFSNAIFTSNVSASQTVNAFLLSGYHEDGMLPKI